MLFDRPMKIIFKTLVVIALIAILWLTSISNNQKPDFAQLFTQSKSVTDQPPVVFIHGLLGSKLRDNNNGQEAWPGSILNILFGNHDHFALTIDPNTLKIKPDQYEAFAIAEETAGKDFYGNIIKTLSEYGGYQEATIGQKIDPQKKHYYTFVYDWRQDNVISAAKLADFIDQIRKNYGDKNLKVDIVAHSMGGLIARYYLRYGRTDVLESNDFQVNLYGMKRVRRVILLGTPNLGSVKQLNVFIDGLDIAFGHIDTEAMGTMPSLFQIMPHPLNDWIINLKGESLNRDLFDIEIWRRFQWGIFSKGAIERIKNNFSSEQERRAYMQTLEAFLGKTLERARRFAWSLTVKLPEEHPTLVVFGGDCMNTPARILVEEVAGESIVRMHPDDIKNPIPNIDYNKLLLEPGDGTVTKASLLGRDVLDPSVPRNKYSFFPLDYGILLCEEHNNLTNNINFQNNLLNALLIRD